MTRVVEIPSHFDDQSFDQFARSFGHPAPDERMLFDAHATTWVSPYGLVAILCAGQWLAEHGHPKPLFTLPQEQDAARYWSRMGFFRHAEDLFEIHGKIPRSGSGASDVLLDVTRVAEADDVHTVVNQVQEHSATILGELGLEAQATLGFAMALSEACQNIVEHAGTSGWVAVQTYNWRRRLGRRVVVIAVADGGVGFRTTLDHSQASRFGDRWGDAAALEAAVFQGISRFRDPGRGQGLQGMRRYVNRWEGKLSLRSGTARLSIVPPWDDAGPLVDNLPQFPGSQVLIIIPAKADD